MLRLQLDIDGAFCRSVNTKLICCFLLYSFAVQGLAILTMDYCGSMSLPSSKDHSTTCQCRIAVQEDRPRD